MKIIYRILIIMAGSWLIETSPIYCQSLSPAAITTDGGYYNAGGSSLSWTLGETCHSTLQAGNIILTQGEQQPYINLRLLNLKAFIEGFYIGGGQMTAVLHNNDPLNYPPNSCDVVSVELHNSGSPYGFVISKNVVLLTDGSALVQFPNTVPQDSYYIVLRHRNSIETWSKVPLLFNGNILRFDFTAP